MAIIESRRRSQKIGVFVVLITIFLGSDSNASFFELFRRSPKLNSNLNIGNIPLYVGPADLKLAGADALWMPSARPFVPVGNMYYAFQTKEDYESTKANIAAFSAAVQAARLNIRPGDTHLIKSPVSRFEMMGYTLLPEGRPDNAFELVRESVYQFCMKAYTAKKRTIMFAPNEFLIFSGLGSEWGSRALLAGIEMARRENATFDQVIITGYGYSDLTKEMTEVIGSGDYVDYVVDGKKDVSRGQTQYYSMKREGYLSHPYIVWAGGTGSFKISTSPTSNLQSIPQNHGNIQFLQAQYGEPRVNLVKKSKMVRKDRNSFEHVEIDYWVIEIYLSEKFLAKFREASLIRKQTILRSIFNDVAHEIHEPVFSDSSLEFSVDGFWMTKLGLDEHPELIAEMLVPMEKSVSQAISIRRMSIELDEKIGEASAVRMMSLASAAIERRYIDHGDFFDGHPSSPRSQSFFNQAPSTTSVSQPATRSGFNDSVKNCRELLR